MSENQVIARAAGDRVVAVVALNFIVATFARNDIFTVAGVDGSIKHEWDAAGYVVGKYPVSDKLELFARGGYGHTELKQEFPGANTDLGDDSWNYGAGANYYLDGVNGVRADWTRRDYRDDAGEADAYSVSYIRRF